MKKIMYLVLALALLMTGWNVYADTPTNPDYAYTRVVGGETPDGKPPMFIRKVRYGRQGNVGGEFGTLASGTVLSWDTVSNDGVTVSMSVGNVGGSWGVAGVAVTPLQSQDAGINSDTSDDHYGWMCVGGWCLANIDISESTNGMNLIPSPTTPGHFSTANSANAFNSQDCGVLLQEAAADGPGAVILHLQ